MDVGGWEEGYTIECESDLTELDSEDDDPLFTPKNPSKETKKSRPVPPPTPIASTSTSTRKSTQAATAKLRERDNMPRLNPPRGTSYSIEHIHQLIEQGCIDLNPEYQRDVVWTDVKQMNLIDSIHHNYYIPPIVLAKSETYDSLKYRCIDGKQRLTSIWRFMKGEIAHKDSVTNRKSWFVKPESQKRPIVYTKDQQQKIKMHQIQCVEYDGITPDQEREIFQRVQMGVSLTPAERLAAVNGPFAQLVREIQVIVNTPGGIASCLEWGHARGKDFQGTAQIVFLLASDKAKPLEPTPTRLEAFLSKKSANPEKLRASLVSVFDVFNRIAHHPTLGKTIGKNNRLTLIEYVMIAFLIYHHAGTLSDAQLADAISQLRAHLRKTSSDMRFNSKTFKAALDYVFVKIKKLNLKGDGKGDAPAFRVPVKRKHLNEEDGGEEADSEDDKPLFQPEPNKLPPAKRARKAASKPEALESDSDDEVIIVKGPAPRRRTTVAGTTLKRPSLASAVSSPAIPAASSKTTVKRTTKMAPQIASGSGARIPKPQPSRSNSDLPQLATRSKGPLPNFLKTSSARASTSSPSASTSITTGSTDRPIVVPFPRPRREQAMSRLLNNSSVLPVKVERKGSISPPEILEAKPSESTEPTPGSSSVIASRPTSSLGFAGMKLNASQPPAAANASSKMNPWDNSAELDSMIQSIDELLSPPKWTGVMPPVVEQKQQWLSNRPQENNAQGVGYPPLTPSASHSPVIPVYHAWPQSSSSRAPQPHRPSPLSMSPQNMLHELPTPTNTPPVHYAAVP